MLRRVTLQTDFCIVGGGMAGICAAISAARQGVHVVLMHERPVLGGNASSEIRMWICGAHGDNNRETGILEEIALENLYRNPTKNYYIWDTVLYDFIMREPNITLLLNCTCMDAQTKVGNFPHGREIEIQSVTGYQMTTQTFFDVSATYFADCSGDSILAPLTGAACRSGREGKHDFGEPTHVEVADDLHMGMSLLLQGRETTQNIPFTPPSWALKLQAEDFNNRHLNIHTSWENYWYLELGGNRHAIHDTEEVSKELLPLALGTWDYIKNSGNQSADTWELDFLGFLPGKRESRRMVGAYTITANDILQNRDFPDVVAYGGWPIDDHYPDGFYHKGQPNTNILPDMPYRIPYRSLYSANVSNLFFAGRNISMTHMAMSSLRVMATCGLMGQAVGTAVAVAKCYGTTPHGVYQDHIQEVQERLMQADCYLPSRTRHISPLCQQTEVLGGNDTLKNGHDRPNPYDNGVGCGVAVSHGEALTYLFEQSQRIRGVHITFDSDLNRATLPGDFCEQSHGMRCNTLLTSPQMHLPLTLCKSFVLEVKREGGWEAVLSVDDNRVRTYHLPLCQDVWGIRLVPFENWGETSATTVFSFDFEEM